MSSAAPQILEAIRLNDVNLDDARMRFAELSSRGPRPDLRMEVRHLRDAIKELEKTEVLLRTLLSQATRTESGV